jgi:HAE1 family hydrophobic/amphiphilic exporter-1
MNGRGEIGLAAVAITLGDVVVFVRSRSWAASSGSSSARSDHGGRRHAVFAADELHARPMLAARWYQKGEHVEARGGVFGAINRFYTRLEDRYRRALAWALRHRGTVIFAGNMALVLVILWMARGRSGTRSAAGRDGHWRRGSRCAPRSSPRWGTVPAPSGSLGRAAGRGGACPPW